MAAAASPARRSPLLVQCLTYLTFAAPLGMYGAAWPDVRGELGQSAGSLGVVMTAYGVGRMTTSASALVVLSRVPIRVATPVVLVLLAAADVVVALTRWFPLMVGAIAVVGLASGALDSMGSRYQTVVRDVRRSGLIAGSYGLGATLGPALVAVTTWTTGYLAVAALALVAAVVAARPGVEWPDGLAEGSRRDGRVVRFRLGPVAISLALVSVAVGVEALTGNWMATYFEDARGATGRAAGLAVSGFWAGVTVGRLGLGRIAVPPRLVLLGAPATLAVLFAGLSVAPLPVALVGLTAVGLVSATFFPTVLATTADRVGRLAAGRVTGWQLLAANTTAIVLGAAVGAGVSRWGAGVSLAVVAALAAAGVPLGVAAAGRLAPVDGPPVDRPSAVGGASAAGPSSEPGGPPSEPGGPSEPDPVER